MISIEQSGAHQCCWVNCTTAVKFELLVDRSCSGYRVCNSVVHGFYEIKSLFCCILHIFNKWNNAV